MSPITRLTFTITLILLPLVNAEDAQSFFSCLSEKSILTCASFAVNREVNRLQAAMPGRQSDVPVSTLIEETSYLFAEGFDTLFSTKKTNDNDETEVNRALAGKNKLHLHKRKKQLKKLLMIGMILKSKIGLLFQIVSVHFQIKFFFIAVLGLIINAARFWLDLKKTFHPSKVVYYEHAQHQHHYDHDDDHGYWGRSLNEGTSHGLAYAAYLPKN